MKTKEVLNLLQISRATLFKYRKLGYLKATRGLNGFWEYDEQSVYNFMNKDIPRITVIYARVSSARQKKDLENQIKLLKQFCFQNGWQISHIYKDIASGISFKDRTDFFNLLENVFNHKIERIVISYKDRISRVGFELFQFLFKKFGTEIIVMSEVGPKKLDSEEIFEEIVSLLHCYSMKLYSKSRSKLVKQLVCEE